MYYYFDITKFGDGKSVFQCVYQVISVRNDELILEAFKKMRDNNIGGLPVVEGPKKKIVGNVSIRDVRFLLLRPELFSNFRYVVHSNLLLFDSFYDN